MRIPWRRRSSSVGDRKKNPLADPWNGREREPWREEGGEGGFVAEGVGSAHSGGEEREKTSL
jgi:hypothetical protein